MSPNDAAMLSRLERWEDEREWKDGTNRREKLALYGLVRHLQPDRVIEIGVSAGGMTSWLAGALEVGDCGRLVSIDDWSQSHGGKADGPETARRRLEDLNLDGRVTLISADSHEWLPKQDTNSADIVWIDGDHSYEGALSDFQEACRIATEFVAFHDITLLDGPKRVAAEISGGVRLRQCRGLLIIEPQ